VSVAVLIPYVSGLDEWRDAAFGYVRDRYRRDFPDWDIVVGKPDRTPDERGPGDPWWSKGEALARARSETEATVLVVADADVFVTRSALARCVRKIVDRAAPWAMPYETVRRLRPETTRALYEATAAGQSPILAPGTLDRREYVGVRGGGIVVLPASGWDACPLDPRFRGWGGEDEAWGRALSTLLGPGWFLDGHVWHLWHPHQTPGARSPLYPGSITLLRAYQSADEVPRLMRALLAGQMPEEAKPLDRPVRFRSPSRVVRAARHNVYFERGIAEVDDPDVVEVLDRMAGTVERV
jgi:hypothetical protein